MLSGMIDSIVLFYDCIRKHLYIVGEPKSRISKKNLNLAPERYTAEFFFIRNALIFVDMKPLYSNATRIAFRGKHAFGMGRR